MKTEIKVLDKGYVKLIDHMGSDKMIVNAARTSYDSKSKSASDDSKLISYLMRHEHSTPFEMCEMIFLIKCPIFVARHIVRHRTASMSEISARYTKLEEDFYVPEHMRVQSSSNKQASEEGNVPNETDILDAITKVSEQMFSLYNVFTEIGVAREQARMILPLNVYTKFYWKMDLRNLLHFLKLRMHPHTQRETQEYARAIAEFVKSTFPVTWEHFENHVLGSLTLSKSEISLIREFGDAKSIREHSDDAPSSKEFLEKLNILGL